MAGRQPWSKVAQKGPDGLYPVDPVIARLRRVRVMRNIKRRTVADRIGCSLTHFARMENGEHQPTLYLLRRWSLALGQGIFCVSVGQDGRPLHEPSD